ncbi:hypothetical protein L227DRAFT_618090 [Lentinus tigrinus ALCF2SS1-6]|uniref:Uncharacterized protein n=1 Tax=Lentinus tigrinus ALCF2SS1-6 TaxID=1328759 RepID=A0A5C2RNK2_9APHY|nr:hypothetical protein L227DRAFT_618090 [Lentinus tigrinus ALCF2SS1-6]
MPSELSKASPITSLLANLSTAETLLARHPAYPASRSPYPTSCCPRSAREGVAPVKYLNALLEHVEVDTLGSNLLVPCANPSLPSPLALDSPPSVPFLTRSVIMTVPLVQAFPTITDQYIHTPSDTCIESETDLSHRTPPERQASTAPAAASTRGAKPSQVYGCAVTASRLRA